MSCEHVEAELIAFHFGTVSEETRAAIEDHLPTCARCVRALLAFKRDLETAEDVPAPSGASRERLREAVIREVADHRPWRRWERSVALAGAVAVLVGAVVVTYETVTGEGHAPRTSSRVSP